MSGKWGISVITAVVALSNAGAPAQYGSDWHRVGGGGGTSSGGAFVLSGTIGQHDAGPMPTMAGGGFGLTGGFWPVTFVCPCLADMNSDGKKNGADVQKFVQCLIAGQGVCICADVNAANGVSVADVPVFVNTLLTQSACP